MRKKNIKKVIIYYKLMYNCIKILSYEFKRIKEFSYRLQKSKR